MRQEEINEICNKIISDGKKPFALIYTSGELKTRPESGWDIFNADGYPEIREIFDSEERTSERLKELGEIYCNKTRSFAGIKFFDCYGYITCGLTDESEEGYSWGIDFDKLIDASPAPGRNWKRRNKDENFF